MLAPRSALAKTGTAALGEFKADYKAYSGLTCSPILMILFWFCFDSRIPGIVFLNFLIILSFSSWVYTAMS